MSSVKKEKHSANSRARRHSSDTKKHKKHRDKDTDMDSVTSSSTSSDTAVLKRCPFRFMLAGMMERVEVQRGNNDRGCPLRRVQLWHILPLCLLAVVNLILVIVALLGLAGYRIATGLQGLVINFVKTDLDINSYAESLDRADDGSGLVI